MLIDGASASALLTACQSPMVGETRSTAPRDNPVLVLAAHCLSAGHRIFLAALFTAQHAHQPQTVWLCTGVPCPGARLRNSARCNAPRWIGVEQVLLIFVGLWRSVRRGQPVVVGNQGLQRRLALVKKFPARLTFAPAARP